MTESKIEIVSPSEHPAAVAIRQEAASIIDTAASLQVVDAPSYERAVEIIAEIGGKQKLVEKQYRAMKDPIVQAGKTCDGFFRPALDKLDEARRSLTSSCSRYRAEQERIRREEEDRIRREQEAAARKAEEDRRAAEALALEAAKKAQEAATSGDMLAQVEAEAEAEAAAEIVSDATARSVEVANAVSAAPTVAAPAKTERLDSGAKVTFAKRWSYEITNPNLVPREFCEPSPARIRAAVQAGAREMAGVRIFEEETARV